MLRYLECRWNQQSTEWSSSTYNVSVWWGSLQARNVLLAFDEDEGVQIQIRLCWKRFVFPICQLRKKNPFWLSNIC